MGSVRFRPLTGSDLDGGPEWFGQVELRADQWRDADTRSAVAVDDRGAVVAVGILWTSRVHSDRYWADIVVDPAHRRAGLGTAMLGHLASLRARGIPFMTRGYVDSARLAFAFACGARTIQIVPPARVSTARRGALRPHDAVVAARRAPFAQVLAAHADMYEWIHRGWSPVSPGFASAVNAGLIDDLDLDASALALDGDGRVRALAAVYRDSDPPVVCAETTRPDQADGERLVEGCLRHALDALAERGVTGVDFDGHVSDPHFLPNWARLAPTGERFLLVEVPA
jgi:GNAT superfamily N-acetyltransferase